MGTRTEKDSMGTIDVDEERLWGAQTQRSFENFAIGIEVMPTEIIGSFAILKASCAKANAALGKMDEILASKIVAAAEGILAGDYPYEFPLKVWQTGSGTQSNMNVNEVIAHICDCHPNDDVNMSQSSNDTFPTAMNIAALMSIKNDLIPAIDLAIHTLKKLENECWDIIKIGRTHLQDAVPLRLGQEVSAWRVMLMESKKMIEDSCEYLRPLAIGGTAVGTGLNCPEGFADICCEHISQYTGETFVSSENKFHSLSSKDSYVFVHGALKGLAANLMKMANDIRWLASGPRCGLGEISIPENEPGSSIMPGKVNPTQCEAITMIAVQVMGNDATIGIAASQGNFQLNVFMPVLAYNMIQSIRLLADGLRSFNKNTLVGIKPNKERISALLNESLMLVTCLSPHIGYERAAQAAHKAHREELSLKEAVLSLGYISEDEYDTIVDPQKMV